MLFNPTQTSSLPSAVVFLSIGLTYSLSGFSQQVSSEKNHSDRILKEIAKSYYSQVAEAEKRIQESQERRQSDRKSGSFTMPMTATGKIVDRWGNPVAGLSVDVTRNNDERIIGLGKTNRLGEFNLELTTGDYRNVFTTVTDEKNKYSRWAQGGFNSGIVDAYIQLDREVNQSFLKQLTAESDEKRRLMLLMEVIGNRQFSLDLPEHYIYIGAMREDLLRIIESHEFEKKAGNASPAERAQFLITVWNADEDKSLIEEWLSNKEDNYKPSQVFSGTTIDEACKAFVDQYWADTKPEQRPTNSMGAPVIDKSEQHAIIDYSVDYAQWGYAKRLVLRKQKEQWVIKLVWNHAHYNYE